MLIPSSVKIAGIALAAALVFGAGAKVGDWRAGDEFRPVEAELRKEIAGLKEQVTDLKSGISEQNHAVDLIKAGAEAAVKVQEEAQKRADALSMVSKKRLDRIEAMIPDAKDCQEVLFKYWSIRQ